jgi:uncharacterized protein (TIGR02444 family)
VRRRLAFFAEVPILEDKEQSSPFWQFSLQVYPHVAEPCLELQDRFGVDVNVLLFLLWAAHHRRKVSPGEVHFITSAVASWNAAVVVPLRNARRALRTPPEVVDREAAGALRQRVKEVEIEAERLQQEALYRFMPIEKVGAPEPSRYTAARCNIEIYAAKLGTVFAGSLIDALLDGFRMLDRPAEEQREDER